MTISVVIITLNEGEFLQHTIDSLRRGLPDSSEIIVVDDGSTDQSTDFLTEGHRDVTLLRPAERLGVSRARNFGAARAIGDILVFSDAHVLVPERWLPPLLDQLACEEVGAVAPAVGTLRPAAVECTGYGQKWSDAGLGVEWLNAHGSRPYPVPLLCGCFLAMRREVFTNVGGFDDGMVVWGAEDSELSIRLWTSGYECRLVPELEIQHRFRASFPYQVNWEPILHNRLRLATLHFGPRRLLRVLERLKKYDDFAAASVRLLSGDLPDRRTQLQPLRRFDDDWFFSKFKNELKSDLCDVNPVSVNVGGAPRVTACLVSWKRPQNLSVIIRSLRTAEFIDEILVWNNNPEVGLELTDSAVRVIESRENLSCYGRFTCAAEARNRIIYVQDDDALNDDLPALYGHFLRDSSRITHALAPTHWNQRNRRIYGEAQMALLGWGAFFRKEWLSVLDELPASIREDPLLLREADAFFTLLLQRKHNAVLTEITHLEDHSTPGIALWCEPAYRRYTSLAIRHALRLLRLKKNPGVPAPWNIVVTCHNYGRYLIENVESILHSDADYEIHIVDDGSSDEAPEVGQELAHLYPHVHYLRNEEQRGPGYSRNKGLAAMDSAFAVLLDCDDLIGADYLYEAGKRLANDADVVNPDAVLFGDGKERWVVPEVTTLEMLLRRNSVHCSSAFRRGLWSRVGGVDEHIPCWEDYHFWIRMAAAGAKIVGIHGNHFFHRRHADSLSNSRQAKRAQFLEHVRQHDQALFQTFAEKHPSGGLNAVE